MAQGKGMLHPHHLVDELENIIGDEKSKEVLRGGLFNEVLRSAQVILSLSLSSY